MASWVRTITSPFRKFFNPNPNTPRDKKSRQQGDDDSRRVMDLHGEVMACAYNDVQVMWSILDKSKQNICAVN